MEGEEGGRYLAAHSLVGACQGYSISTQTYGFTIQSKHHLSFSHFNSSVRLSVGIFMFFFSEVCAQSPLNPCFNFWGRYDIVHSLRACRSLEHSLPYGEPSKHSNRKTRGSLTEVNPQKKIYGSNSSLSNVTSAFIYTQFLYEKGRGERERAS